MNRFLDIEQLEDGQIEHLLALANQLQREPVRTDLNGKVLGLVFLNPSLRTLTSFQAGIAQLGGSSFVITPGAGSWALETKSGVVMDGNTAEHIREAIPVLEEYADALGVRCFAGGVSLDEDLEEPMMTAMAACSSKPLINMESAINHPCQALADWKTLDDLSIPRHTGKFVLSWAWHPKALPLAVPSAVATMAARRGMDVTILRPEGFGLPAPIMDRVRGAADRGGGSITETDDRTDAMRGAHVIYAKSWQAPSAYGDAEKEQTLRADLRDWCVDETWFTDSHDDASFLHCLPVRRNVVVKDEILDGPRSQVVKQAGNRLHVQKAVLMKLLGDS